MLSSGLRIFREEEAGETIIDVLREENSEVQFLEGCFDDALIGIQRHHNQPPVAAYDYWGCIHILEESLEYWEAVQCFQEMLSSLPDNHKPVFIELEDAEE